VSNIHDIVIIGAGSVGTPAAFYLAESGFKVAVIEKYASPGQGQNKSAIGGIRATHSDAAKIWLCQDSLKAFSTWKEKYGDDIGWIQGGYTFPAYSEETEKMLKDLLIVQKKYGLNINWISKEEIKEIVPGIYEKELRGGTFSPEDGNASPLSSINAFYFRAKEKGADFYFNEKVINITVNNGKIENIRTNKNIFSSKWVINTAGAEAGEIGKMINLNIPIMPDSHEACITEPIARLFYPLVVDLRKRPGSKNFYFYQNAENQLVICLTPEPIIPGTDRRSTSKFLLQVSRRMIETIPRLANLKIRRIWRGLYPMTPDGFPIISTVKNIEGLILAVGMCGQGFMLGPGTGMLITRLISEKLNKKDNFILNSLSLYRSFSGMEAFK